MTFTSRSALPQNHRFCICMKVDPTGVCLLESDYYRVCLLESVGMKVLMSYKYIAAYKNVTT